MTQRGTDHPREWRDPCVHGRRQPRVRRLRRLLVALRAGGVACACVGKNSHLRQVVSARCERHRARHPTRSTDVPVVATEAVPSARRKVKPSTASVTYRRAHRPLRQAMTERQAPG
jgi:hypothetical protein